MTPIERAARALARTDYPPEPEEDDWRFLVPAVRAVLTAIREPSEGMVRAGGEQVLDAEFGAGQYESIADGRGSKVTADDQAMKAYQAMIDAAVAEGQPS